MQDRGRDNPTIIDGQARPVDNRASRAGRRMPRRRFLVAGVGLVALGVPFAAGYLYRNRIFGSSAEPVEQEPAAAPVKPVERATAVPSVSPPETRPVATAEITQPIIDDARAFIKAVLKPAYQDRFAANADIRGMVTDNLKQGRRVTVNADAMAVQVSKTPEADRARVRAQLEAERNNLMLQPQYRFEIGQSLQKLAKTLVPPVLTLDYLSPDALVVARRTLSGQLPLKDIPAVSGSLKPSKLPDGREFSEIPADKANPLLALAVREVVNLKELVAPNTLSEKISGNEYRAMGILNDSKTSVEVVASRSGRFSVQLGTAAYQARPGERPMELPPYPPVPQRVPSPAPSPAPRPA